MAETGHHRSHFGSSFLLEALRKRGLPIACFSFCILVSRSGQWSAEDGLSSMFRRDGFKSCVVLGQSL